MKKDKAIPALAIIGIGLAAAYMYSMGSTGESTGTEGWTGGTGTRSLTPITTTTTETIPIGGGKYPQIVLPAIQPYEPAPIPAGLFSPPVIPQTTGATPAPITKKEQTVTVATPPVWDTEIAGATMKSGFDLLSIGAPFNLPLSMSKIVTSYIGGGGETKKTDAVKLSESWAGPVTGITAGGKSLPVTLQSGGSSGIPAEGIHEFFYAGKAYGAPTGTAPAAGGGTTYYYESGAYQTVQQGQIVSAGSAGALTPSVQYSGQHYAAPGTAAGGEKGRVYSKKAAQLAGLI